jgi:cytochrome bd-type quinol oxidase subunit 2
MSRLREEIRQIPRVGWWIAALVYVGLMILFVVVTFPKRGPLWEMTLFAPLIPLAPATYVLLVSYINGDARRRGMRHVLWTLLAIFIPNAIGIILYFILRHPLLVPCGSCGTLSRSAFAFCRACGGALGPACPQCRKAVETDWSNCAYCGAKLS